MARRHETDLDAVGEILARSVAPVAPSPGLRDRILGATRPESRLAGLVDRVAWLFDLPTETCRTLLARVEDPAAPWERPPLDGARLLHFEPGPRLAGAHCGLVELAPGVVFPEHEHSGTEITLALRGRGREDDGAVIEPGDLVVRELGTRHTLRSLGDEPWLFAVALLPTPPA